jgi:hypothetical protein
MKKAKRLLKRVAKELVEGKDILKKEKKKFKKAKNPLAKKNKKRAMKVIEQAVESLEEHKALLKKDFVPSKH